MPNNYTEPTATISVRPAVPEDAPVIASLHVGSWRSSYRGIVSDETLDGLSIEKRVEKWLEWFENPPLGSCLLVAEGEIGMMGFVSAGPARPEAGDVGEVYAIYLAQAAQRQGAGRALMRQAAHHLIDQGFRSMQLWVFKDNTPARKFYEALGGKYLREQPIDIGSQRLLEVAYGWNDLANLAKE